MSNLRSWRGRSVFFPAQLGDRTMMTLGLQRSVLLLLCVASVLLSGCVSKGKYNDLEGQIQCRSAGTIHRSAGTISTAAAVVCGTGGAKFRGNCRPEEGGCRRQGARQPAAGRHQVHRQQRLVVPVGLLGDVPAGAGAHRQAGPAIGAVSAVEARGERLYRQRPSRAGAASGRASPRTRCCRKSVPKR